MLLEEYEINMILEALDNHTSNALYGDIIAKQVSQKIKRLQSSSKNKRYSLRSTDWLSEAARKQRRKAKVRMDEGLL